MWHDLPASADCLAVDFTLSAPTELPGDKGSLTFDDYVSPGGQQITGAEVWQVRPGATRDFTIYVAGGEPGGVLYVSIGILNRDMRDHHVQVPAF